MMTQNGIRPVRLRFRVALALVVPVLLVSRSGNAQRPAERPAPPAGAAKVLGTTSANQDAEDDDEREFRRAVAKVSVRDNCLICHSEELIASQRLTPVQWKAEVTKMVGWGSPLPADQAQPVIEFLSETYSDKTPDPNPARMSVARAAADLLPTPAPAGAHAGDSAEGAKLFAAQCATCHGPTGQGADLGPNLVETPVLLRPADFSGVIEQGRRRMPGFRATLKSEQEIDILSWLRRQRFIVPVVR